MHANREVGRSERERNDRHREPNHSRLRARELFDYCVDIRNELEWNPTAKSMEKLTDGPVGVGTKFLARWKGAPSAMEVACLEFERPRRWVHDNGGPIAVTFTGTVEPVVGGSLLRARFDARPRGWSGWCSRRSW